MVVIAGVNYHQLRLSHYNVRKAKLEEIILELEDLARRKPRGWSDEKCLRRAEELFLIGHSCETISLELDKRFDEASSQARAKYFHRTKQAATV